MFYEWGWKPYVSAAERRRKAAVAMAKLRKRGQAISPVVIEGRAIVRTFWGKAWCDNLERYSDYANRLPRGRTYVRNGSVTDLQIAAGEIKALVAGSEMYKVAVKITPVARARWKSICKDCAGAIDSLIELLQGRFSKGVMERICMQKTGLFPSPAEIELSCTCPDWAEMCKHVAAVLYGIGARLDDQPELLFRLHQVDEKELIAKAGDALPLAMKGPAKSKVLAGEDLSDVFGLDMAGLDMAQAATAAGFSTGPNGAKRKPKTKAKALKALKKGKIVSNAKVKSRAGARAGEKQKRGKARAVPKKG